MTFSCPRHLLTLFVAALLAGCPRPVDPAAAPAITSPVPEANQELAAARRLFEAGDWAGAEQAFSRFVETRPDDPLAPLARVYLGRVALQQGRPERARELLAQPAGLDAASPVGVQARYFMGLALVRAEAFLQGRQALAPFLEMNLEPARLAAVLAAMAHAGLSLGDDLAATAGHLARLHELSERPVERAFARRELERLLGATLPEAEVRRLLASAPSDSLLAALAGRRLAGSLARAGRSEEAKKILEDTASARAEHRVTAHEPAAGPAALRGDLVGLLVPLHGRFSAAGQQVLAGAMEGAGSFPEAGSRATGVTLLVRDSSRDPAQAAQELIGEGVMALVGTLDPAATRAVSAVASRQGIPFIALSSRQASTGSPGLTFFILPENRRRAEALGRWARARGQKSLVILAPRNPYGEALGEAMAAVFQGAGGTVVSRMSYPPGTTDFTDLAGRCARLQFDTLFVPDTARRLALIAPALARAGLWPMPAGHDAGRRGEKIRALELLSTADGLSAKLVQAGGTYVEGAVLAPGHFPDDQAAGSGPLVLRFVNSHGRPPTLLEAFAHDALIVVGAHGRARAGEGAALRSALLGPGGIPGLSGRIRFGADGARADSPLLYQVTGGRIRQIEPLP